MADVNNIRFQFYHEGLNISEISKKTGHDHKTIRKYLDQKDFNVTPAPISTRCSKLDPFTDLIDSWLKSDRKAPRKQKHTATRVFKRLVKECPGFDASYRTVANYFKARRKELFKSGGFLPLEHPPGEAQVDFGKTDYIESGKLFNGSHLVFSFPNSNAGYALLFPSESAECLFEGMKMIFERIGGVPTKIWFDNASSMVIRILKEGERKQTESFLRFKNHYGFDAVFCNPSSGHEKGSVENKVGYTRRNMFVPIPKFRCLEQFNKEQLARCEEDFQRAHYKCPPTLKGALAPVYMGGNLFEKFWFDSEDLVVGLTPDKNYLFFVMAKIDSEKDYVVSNILSFHLDGAYQINNAKVILWSDLSKVTQDSIRTFLKSYLSEMEVKASVDYVVSELETDKRNYKMPEYDPSVYKDAKIEYRKKHKEWLRSIGGVQKNIPQTGNVDKDEDTQKKINDFFKYWEEYGKTHVPITKEEFMQLRGSGTPKFPK
jgi:transposase